jgi:hypothetical protein
VNWTPNRFVGVLGLLALGGVIIDVLTSKNTAANITSASNGYANIEKSALHG